MTQVRADGSYVPEFVESTVMFDAVSIASSGSADSAAVIAEWARRARVIIPSSGADVTVKLQTSLDGTSWHDLASYAVAATGAQAVVDLCDRQLRLSASNAGLSAQSVTAHLVLQA